MNSRRHESVLRPLARACAVPLALVAALSSSGCDAIESTISAPPPETRLQVAPDFDQQGIVEIAILPIRRPLDFGEAEGDELRNEIYAELLTKNFTPLDPSYVAKKLPQPFVAEGLPDVATLKRSIPADGYVMVDLHKAALENVEGMHPRYRLDATLFVFEPNGGQRVYEHALTQTYDVRLDGSQTLSGRERREKFKLFAGRLLTGLPTRRVR